MDEANGAAQLHAVRLRARRPEVKLGGARAPLGRLPVADHPGFALSLLGGFRLLTGKGAVGVPRSSQRLLVYLALHGGMVDRAAVAGRLWPDVTERQASTNLRSAIARLKRGGRGALVTSKRELGLADGVAVDLRHGQRLAGRLLDPTVAPDRSELGPAALAVLSAELLPGWYDDWVLDEAEDWRLLRLHALEALAGHLRAAGRWGEAAGAARAAVRAEPLRESGHVALVQAHLAQGNQSEALRQYAHYRDLLRAELGLEPTLQLSRLVEDLRVAGAARGR
jgi:DNA-binding SARP family transcriptional activator